MSAGRPTKYSEEMLTRSIEYINTYQEQELDEKPRMNLSRFYKTVFHGAHDAR